MVAATARVLELDGPQLARALKEHERTFVKFFAPWCGHCKRLAPAWEALAERDDLNGAAVARVDCTRHAAACSKYGVRAFPTLLLIERDRAALRKYIGGRNIDSLSEFVRKGWKDTPLFDPTTMPPPSPRKSLLDVFQGQTGYIIIIVGFLVAFLICICAYACYATTAELAEERQQRAIAKRQD
eukprot:scaffold1934_cov27-Tisochrysis_lutea.AAC.1